MSKSLWLTSATLLLALGAAAQAQEGGLRPVQDGGQAAPPPDVGGWLGDDTAAPAPVQAQGQDPLALPQSEPVPEAAPAPDPAEERRRGRRIDSNYQKALDIYDDIGKPQHDLAALERRIANNERIVREYTAKIEAARDQRRNAQSELYNRMFYLRQQKENGEIDEKAFERLSRDAERAHEDRGVALKGDIEGWKQEVAQAQARLASLQSERRLLQASLPRPNARRGKKGAEERPVAPPGARLLSSLEQRLAQLDAFELRHPLDRVHPRDLGASSVGLRPVSRVSSDEDEE